MMAHMNRRTLLCGTLGTVALVGGGYWAWRATNRRAPVSDGVDAHTAPDTHAVPASGADLYALSWPDLNGQPQPLARYQGRPLLVNFWATWCAPCVKEMPELDLLAQRFAGVAFLGIGIDTAANMRDFVKKIPVTYPLLVAGYEGIDVLRALGNPAGGLPFTVIYDASGQPLRHILGELEPDDVAQTLARLAS